MERPPVELRVGGQTYRVVGTAAPTELQRLASIVDGKLREMHTTTAFHPQSMLLVAMTLAHEAEQERARRKEAEQRSRDMLQSLLERVDRALELVPDEVDVDASGVAPQDGPPATI
jgi:cell division protein ZapA